MSGTALGELLDVDRSTVSRLESGGIKLQEKHAKVVDHEWHTDELFAVLVHHARTGHHTEGLHAHLCGRRSPGVPGQLPAYDLDPERAARVYADEQYRLVQDREPTAARPELEQAADALGRRGG